MIDGMTAAAAAQDDLVALARDAAPAAAVELEREVRARVIDADRRRQRVHAQAHHAGRGAAARRARARVVARNLDALGLRLEFGRIVVQQQRRRFS